MLQQAHVPSETSRRSRQQMAEAQLLIIWVTRGQLLNLCESIINLLNKDNGIDFARLWWGLMSDNKVFNHFPTFLLF